jgi:hypothetical protein
MPGCGRWNWQRAQSGDEPAGARCRDRRKRFSLALFFTNFWRLRGVGEIMLVKLHQKTANNEDKSLLRHTDRKATAEEYFWRNSSSELR